MDINEATVLLNDQFKERDWFVKVVAKHKTPQCIIVYTKWQTEEILREIPNRIEEWQILVHFYHDKATIVSKIDDVAKPVEQKLTHSVLTRELERLGLICGTNTLESIFFEVHDGKNAVTDMSKRYPEVREDIETLFRYYGFNLLYKEITG